MQCIDLSFEDEDDCAYEDKNNYYSKNAGCVTSLPDVF